MKSHFEFHTKIGFEIFDIADTKNLQKAGEHSNHNKGKIMKILNFFRRNTKNSNVGDIKAEMIMTALEKSYVYDALVAEINEFMETPEQVDSMIFSLTRATGALLKALQNAGYPVKSQYEEMLNVWLNDVDDWSNPFEGMLMRFDKYKGFHY